MLTFHSNSAPYTALAVSVTRVPWERPAAGGDVEAFPEDGDVAAFRQCIRQSVCLQAGVRIVCVRILLRILQHGQRPQCIQICALKRQPRASCRADELLGSGCAGGRTKAATRAVHQLVYRMQRSSRGQNWGDLREAAVQGGLQPAAAKRPGGVLPAGACRQHRAQVPCQRPIQGRLQCQNGCCTAASTQYDHVWFRSSLRSVLEHTPEKRQWVQ
jgi:hypothetical protein